LPVSVSRSRRPRRRPRVAFSRERSVPPPNIPGATGGRWRQLCGPDTVELTYSPHGVPTAVGATPRLANGPWSPSRGPLGRGRPRDRPQQCPTPRPKPHVTAQAQAACGWAARDSNRNPRILDGSLPGDGGQVGVGCLTGVGVRATRLASFQRSWPFPSDKGAQKGGCRNGPDAWGMVVAGATATRVAPHGPGAASGGGLLVLPIGLSQRCPGAKVTTAAPSSA
jgi:hypothetical protein